MTRSDSTSTQHIPPGSNAYKADFRETTSSTVGGRKWTNLDTALTFLTVGIWVLIYLIIRNNNSPESVESLKDRGQPQATLGSSPSHTRTRKPFHWEQPAITSAVSPPSSPPPGQKSVSVSSAAPASTTSQDQADKASRILRQIQNKCAALRNVPTQGLVEQSQSFLETLEREHKDLIEANPSLKAAVIQLVSLIQSIQDQEEQEFVQQLCQKILLGLKPENFSAKNAEGLLRLLEGGQSFLVTKYPTLLSEPVRRLRAAVQSSQSA